MFKLRQTGQTVTVGHLHFHTQWIDNNAEVSPHPINSILFRQLNEDLAEQVRKKKKKPIFDQNEQLKLKPSTTRAVVELLQDYDLHGIDDDLNGRMFEVFLSAAVRGKNLGAFFTPRNIVELMVAMCNPTVSRIAGKSRIDSVLDGCCGSGGFLIDAMAYMLDQIRTNPTLTPHARELEETLLAKHLYGIESNPDIARIARINMFLHGDGGSRIYRADTLDNAFVVEEGDDRASRDDISELEALLATEGYRFDIVLTNPPFASAYSANDEHEKRILAQYNDLHANATKTKKSAKSNVLFLARYHSMLVPGGRMAIVVDNSLLNSHNFADYRRWLLDRFIVRAVISLPKYSFIQAGAGGVTSILYLVRLLGLPSLINVQRSQ
jgi:type I restriction enzyme M protein